MNENDWPCRMDDFFAAMDNGAAASSSAPRFSDTLNADLDGLPFFDPTVLHDANGALDMFHAGGHDDAFLERPRDYFGYGGTTTTTTTTTGSHSLQQRVAAVSQSHDLVARPRTHAFSFPQMDHSMSASFFPSNISFANFHQPMHLAADIMPDHGAFCNPFGDFTQPMMGRRLSVGEDDNASITASSLCSHCSHADPCTGTACASDACASEACADDPSACTDLACPTAVAPDVATAAYTLASFVEGQAQGHEQSQQILQYPTGMNPTGFSVPTAQPGDDVLTGPLGWSNPLGYLEAHLKEAHGDPNMSNCTRPCPIDNPMWFQQCHFRHFPADAASHNSMPPVPDFFSTQPMHMCEPDECGARNANPQAFIQHFNQEHRPFMFEAVMHPGSFSHGQPMQSPPGLTPSSSSSPLDAAVKSLPISPATLPSPRTPLPKDGSIMDLSLHGFGGGAVARRPSSASMNSQITMTPEDEYKCFWCDMPDKIDACGLVFENADDLHEHVIQEHVKSLAKGPSGFCCGWQQCRRGTLGKDGFPQRSKIERHMQTHTGSKPYACDTCGHVFSAKQALEQHRLIHNDSRPLKCDFPGCGRTFRQQSALTMHKRTHTGEKPLVCNICNRAFSESSNLSKHKRTHDVQGRFQCSYLGCKKNFHRLDQLRRHKKQHESNAPQAPSQSGSASDLETTVKEETSEAGEAESQAGGGDDLPVKSFPETRVNPRLAAKLSGLDESLGTKRRRLTESGA